MKLGFDGLFVVDRVGRSGGLALFWRSSATVTLLNYTRNFIDVHVEVAGLGDWRLTGFYGYPESSRRRQSWVALVALFVLFFPLGLSWRL